MSNPEWLTRAIDETLRRVVMAERMGCRKNTLAYYENALDNLETIACHHGSVVALRKYIKDHPDAPFRLGRVPKWKATRFRDE